MSKNEKEFGGLTMQVRDFATLLLRKRLGKALDEGVARYPIFRELRFAARIELEVLFDAIALDGAWRAERLGWGALILDADGLLVSAYGNRKADYCSCSFHIWAADLARAQAVKARLLAKAGSTRITEPMFSIDWAFLQSSGELETGFIEEIANDVLHDAAYPEIKGGVRGFIARYSTRPRPCSCCRGRPERARRASSGRSSARCRAARASRRARSTPAT